MMMSLRLRRAQAGQSLSALISELEDTKNSCKIIIRFSHDNIISPSHGHQHKKISTELT